MRRYAGRGNWMQVANRPVRPMTTVVLDATQKLQLLADVNEYLHPATARWYANRGIPLRRGYLFHGPPGTGKTSLSFALAGVFGLDIYVISLLEPSLTEEDVGVLFNSLPRRCVVLLEDIDTAGLTRGPDTSSGKEGGKQGAAPINEWKVTDLAKALKDSKAGNNENNGISLSGLLNAIDGVASHEGRVLIMTTNKPETLDEALLRPGRVDLQVAFTNATKMQAKELFERMYEADQTPLRRRRRGHNHNDQAAKQEAAKEKAALRHTNGRATHGAASIGGEPVSRDDEPKSTADIQDDERLKITSEELSEIAGDFAQKIPEDAFSPAEIQGFLLKRKKLPHKALAEVDKWIEAMVESKASKAKVLQVQ
jgi:chaperone BCS1